MRLRGPPRGRLATPPHEVGDAHPDDGAPALRVEAEVLTHPLKGRPVRVFDLREGGKAHGVTSRHCPRISQPSQPGSPATWVPKHS